MFAAIAAEALQINGGIGFTRVARPSSISSATSYGLLIPGPEARRERIAEHIGL